jgi:hypothetical protein
MFMLSLALLSLLSTSASALTLEVVGPCSETPVHRLEASVRPGSSVGAVTVSLFEAHGIPYQGTEAGLNSILNTPMGDDAIELISDRELRAYGWCYEVDGRQPDLMPDQVRIEGSEHILWFYGFAHYKNGSWLTYCEPAHKIRPAKFC